MKRRAVLIDEKDNVLTVLDPVAAGEWVSTGGEELLAVEEIPQYHKIARREIKRGQQIYKYGQPMGYATADITTGQWVHTHNAASEQPEGDGQHVGIYGI